MTVRPESVGFDDDRSLRDAAQRIVSGRCVLFDFDGPLCLLFPGTSSAPLADDLRRIVARRDASALLSPAALETFGDHRSSGDPVRRGHGSAGR